MEFDSRRYRVTRGELHKRLWSEKMTTLARVYALTTGRFREACDHFSIPQPPLGFWNMPEEKRKATPIKPLRKNHDPDEVIDLWPFRRTKPVRSHSEIQARSLSRCAKLHKNGARTAVLGKAMGPAIELARLDEIEDSENDMLFLFAIRRLSMMSRIISQLRKYRFDEITTERSIKFVRNDVTTEVHVRFLNTQTGELRVEVGGFWRPTYAFADGLKQSVEDRLPEIVAAVLKSEADELVAREKARLQAIEDAKAEKLRQEAARRARADDAAWQLFETAAAQSEKASRIRAFISRLREELPDETLPIGSADVQRWLAWAVKHAAKIDPLTAGAPTFLKRISDQREAVLREPLGIPPWQPPTV